MMFDGVVRYVVETVGRVSDYIAVVGGVCLRALGTMLWRTSFWFDNGRMAEVVRLLLDAFYVRLWLSIAIKKKRPV